VNDRQALEWAASELVELVNIRSYSHQESEFVAHLSERLGEQGWSVHPDPVEGSGPNLVVGETSRPTLLLTAHTDTITPGWECGAASVDGTVVRGLGAQDDKGGIVAGLLALMLARDDGVDLGRTPVGLGLCVDEEAGGTGSLQMASAVQPEYVVALEGTGLRVATAEAGYVDSWIDVEGQTAHHSFGRDGDNAIENAAGLIHACTQAPFTTVEHPLGAPNRVSVHAFSSPQELNVVPDRARFFLESQFFVPTTPERVIADLTELCGRHRARLHVEDSVPGFETPSDAWLPRATLAATAAVLRDSRGPTYMPAWTDAHNFATVSRAETIVFGPGHLRSAHGPGEQIDVREIVKAARVLAAVIADLARGGA